MSYPAGIYLTALIFIMTPSFLSAQESHPYVLNGYMGVEGGESFHYKLELQDSAGDYLKGYSYTFSDNKSTVKTALAAQRDPLRKTLRIQEQEIIYNNHFHSRAVICLVNALLHFEEQQNTLTGPVITRTIEHGATCSKGSITFIHEQEINALFSGAQKPEIAVKQVPDATRPIRPAPGSFSGQKGPHKPVRVKNDPPPSLPEKITEGKAGLYDWSSDKVTFRIWDGSDVDNDRVTVLFNGRPVLENYTLSKDQKVITFDLSDSALHVISVIALNEGNTPPNTANIMISDGARDHHIIAYNKITKTAIIRIRRKK